MCREGRVKSQFRKSGRTLACGKAEERINEKGNCSWS
jgi:hypothetical protein